MKKLGTIACAALASLCTANLSAAVESDIVGYTTITMEAGKWYQVGYPFELLDGGDLTVNNTFINGFKDGDTLMVLDNANKRYNAPFYWIESKNAWCDYPADLEFIAQPVAFELEPGQAVYINKKVTSDVVLSGKVSLEEQGLEVVAPIANFGDENGNAWDQVAIIWPEEKAINEYSWEGVKNNDTLMILDVEKKRYETPLYWIESKNAWCDYPADLEFIAQPVTRTLKGGQAVYINKISKGVGGVRFKK